MNYPAQYLHSDSLVLRTEPKYQGVTVPPRRDNLFNRPPLVIAQPTCPRPNAALTLHIPSKGLSC